MTLSNDQIDSLKSAILGYSHPLVTKDFTLDQEYCHPDMRSVEDLVRRQLTSRDTGTIKDGLSSVLYWGHATRLQFRDSKVRDFRTKVKQQQLEAIGSVFRESRRWGPDEMIERVRAKRLPQFGFAFATKVAMFLDPVRFVTLDSHIAKLASSERRTVLTGLTLRPSQPGVIPWSRNNAEVYKEWCRVCIAIADEIDVRAADVERGIFTMSQQGKQEGAAEIIAAY